MMKEVMCVAIDDEPIALSVISSFCQRKGGVSLVTFTDPEEALQRIPQISPELVFLDVEMSGISGIEIAKKLPKDCAVIFTTAYAQYALEGFELGVTDFLHKPFSYSRFEKALDKAFLLVEYIRSKKENQIITVKEEYLNVQIPVSEIIYIESMNNYCKIWRTGDVCNLTRMTLKSLIDLLPEAGFKRIHRSFVVAIDKIASFSKSEVKLSNGKILPVGRQYADVR